MLYGLRCKPPAAKKSPGPRGPGLEGPRTNVNRSERVAQRHLHEP